MSADICRIVNCHTKRIKDLEKRLPSSITAQTEATIVDNSAVLPNTMIANIDLRTIAESTLGALDPGSRFGCSVGIDDKFAVVGAFRQNNPNGDSIYIFEKMGVCGSWTFITQFREEGTQLGRKVSISGNTIAALKLTTTNPNAVAVAVAIYDRNGGSWSKTTDITGLTLVENISLCGDFLAVNGPSNMATVAIFERNRTGMNNWGGFAIQADLAADARGNDISLVADANNMLFAVVRFTIKLSLFRVTPRMPLTEFFDIELVDTAVDIEFTNSISISTNILSLGFRLVVSTIGGYVIYKLMDPININNNNLIIEKINNPTFGENTVNIQKILNQVEEDNYFLAIGISDVNNLSGEVSMRRQCNSGCSNWGEIDTIVSSLMPTDNAFFGASINLSSSTLIAGECPQAISPSDNINIIGAYITDSINSFTYDINQTKMPTNLGSKIDLDVKGQIQTNGFPNIGHTIHLDGLDSVILPPIKPGSYANNQPKTNIDVHDLDGDNAVDTITRFNVNVDYDDREIAYSINGLNSSCHLLEYHLAISYLAEN